MLDRSLVDVQPDPQVITRDRNQTEVVLTPGAYLARVVSEARIEAGRAALVERRELLARIGAAYGVPPEVLVAIWGIESSYGTNRGHCPVIAALVTLAHDGRRAALFERELLAALRVIETGEVAPEAMRGSWAGAMGHTQFMPSSWLAHAVDFDGDGRRDIWGDDPTDALASAAAYLAKHGWRTDQPWGQEVVLPGGYTHEDDGQALPLADWSNAGVRPVEGRTLSDETEAELFLPAGAAGPAFLRFANFDVLRLYNASDSYVLAVGHLADRIAGRAPIHAIWPEGRALTRDEWMALQRGLAQAGFDPGTADGIPGPQTRRALRAFQRSIGLAADDHATPDLLALL